MKLSEKLLNQFKKSSPHTSMILNGAVVSFLRCRNIQFSTSHRILKCYLVILKPFYFKICRWQFHVPVSEQNLYALVVSLGKSRSVPQTVHFSALYYITNLLQGHTMKEMKHVQRYAPQKTWKSSIWWLKENRICTVPFQILCTTYFLVGCRPLHTFSLPSLTFIK